MSYYHTSDITDTVDTMYTREWGCFGIWYYFNYEVCKVWIVSFKLYTCDFIVFYIKTSSKLSLLKQYEFNKKLRSKIVGVLFKVFIILKYCNKYIYCKKIGKATYFWFVIKILQYRHILSFQSVVTNGTVSMSPFDVRPSVLELMKGETGVIEVVFSPKQVRSFTQEVTLVCDNCHIKHFLLRGMGKDNMTYTTSLVHFAFYIPTEHVRVFEPLYPSINQSFFFFCFNSVFTLLATFKQILNFIVMKHMLKAISINCWC